MSIFTLVGSWIWSYLFPFVGIKLGDNLEPLRHVMHRLDLLVGVVLIGGVSWWVWRHLKGLREPMAAEPAATVAAAAAEE